jgi:sec-independent protein translocase protein TatB
MFGLSWAQITIIVLVGVFVLGPERIPTAVTWVLSTLRKARTMAAGAQAELRREIGPEIEELRRQVADLQSLKEIQDLRDLRDLHPKRLIGKNILGDEFSGGISGFLGLGAQPPGEPGAGQQKPPAGSDQPDLGQPADPASATNLNGHDVATPGSAGIGTATAGTATAGTATAAVTAAARNGAAGGAIPPHLPPTIARLAAPRVVGGAPGRSTIAAAPRSTVRPSDGRPPFDPDGT